MHQILSIATPTPVLEPVYGSPLSMSVMTRQGIQARVRFVLLIFKASIIL